MPESDYFLSIRKDDIDMAEFEKFKKEHQHSDLYFGAIGGHLQYISTPTSIGMMCSIKCSHCDEEKSITNFDNF